MFPLTPTGLRTTGANSFDRIGKTIELPDTDVTQVRSLSIAEALFPKLRPGDDVYLSSGGSGVFRRVVRVEPIDGGSIVIWHGPRHR